MHLVLNNKKAVVVLLGPALVFYIGIVVIPVIWSFVLSGYTGNLLRGFEWVGFDNFERLIHDRQAHDALKFTFKYSIVITTLQISLGYLLALLYTFVLRKSSTFVRTVVFLPVVLPTVAVALLFNRFFQFAPTSGPVNSMMSTIGLDQVDFAADGGKAFIMLIVMDLWRTMGFFAVLLYAGLVEIPEDIIAAARVDGAGGIRLVRHIIVPLSRPVLFASIIFSFNASLKVFDSVLALTRGGPGRDTTPLNLFMYRTSFVQTNYGYGSAIAILITVLSLIATLAVIRQSRRDVSKA